MQLNYIYIYVVTPCTQKARVWRWWRCPRWVGTNMFQLPQGPGPVRWQGTSTGQVGKCT